MNKIAALVLAMLLSVCVISDCRSQDDTDGPELMTADGKVTGVDRAAFDHHHKSRERAYLFGPYECLCHERYLRHKIIRY